MIKFLCWEPNEVITINNRKEAFTLIKKESFKKYKNVVIVLETGEEMNLNSPRAKEYFGIKR